MARLRGEGGKSTMEEDYSPENMDRCPGFQHLEYSLLNQRYSTLIRCDMTHPHREAISISPDGYRERVRAYGWVDRLATRAEALKAIEQRRRRLERGNQERASNVCEIRGGGDEGEDRFVALAEDVPPDIADWLGGLPPV